MPNRARRRASFSTRNFDFLFLEGIRGRSYATTARRTIHPAGRRCNCEFMFAIPKSTEPLERAQASVQE
jgi:hypothetical protein